MSLHVDKSFKCTVSIGVLPDRNNSVDEEDQEDNERLNISGDTFITIVYNNRKERLRLMFID